MAMMHSAAVCSSVTRRLLLESCCKGHHGMDCQAAFWSRPGFIKNWKASSEFIGVTRIEKFRVFPARAGVLCTKAFEDRNSENENAVRNEKSWTEAKGLRSDEAKPSGSGEQGQNLVHALHEAAAVFQSAMEEQESLTRGPWFAQKWLGIDKNAWMRALAYQAITHLQKCWKSRKLHDDQLINFNGVLILFV